MDESDDEDKLKLREEAKTLKCWRVSGSPLFHSYRRMGCKSKRDFAEIGKKRNEIILQSETEIMIMEEEGVTCHSKLDNIFLNPGKENI